MEPRKNDNEEEDIHQNPNLTTQADLSRNSQQLTNEQDHEDNRAISQQAIKRPRRNDESMRPRREQHQQQAAMTLNQHHEEKDPIEQGQQRNTSEDEKSELIRLRRENAKLREKANLRGEYANLRAEIANLRGEYAKLRGDMEAISVARMLKNMPEMLENTMHHLHYAKSQSTRRNYILSVRIEKSLGGR